VEDATALGDPDLGTHLTQHQGWRHIAKRLGGYRENVASSLSRRLMAGEEIPTKEVSFLMGYAQAIEDVLNFPERVEKRLERAALDAWENFEAREADGDEAPYA
jgi:hypothetical protein